MSFKFNWQFFDISDLKARTKSAITESIAQTRRPPVIAAPIKAVDIDFGTIPPDLAFKDILSVGLNRTHIQFHLKYDGDFSLTLDTAVDANPLAVILEGSEFPDFVKPRQVGLLHKLVLPFRLKVCQIRLDTLIDVVYTPNGVLVNFHEDPIKYIGVQSSLDEIPGVHNMICTELKEQLTASFYEDVPESVWTSSNPAQMPPDPFRGARRWSRHTEEFKKFTNIVIPTSRPAFHQKLTTFNTLALNIADKPLLPPLAISSRAQLKIMRSSKIMRSDKNLDPSHMQQYLLAPSLRSVGVASIGSGSSMRSSVSSTRHKPKRRVISLRNLGAMVAPNRSESRSEPKTPPKQSTQQSTSGFSRGSSPLRPVQRNTPSVNERSTNAANTNGANTNAASSSVGLLTEPHTPEMEASEYAVDEAPAFVPLPPGSWDRRRFSTPNRMDNGAPLKVPKHRATSMQPSRTNVPTLPAAKLPHSPFLRSPGRLSSTNDLIKPT